jgi:hypothetical protein
MSSVATLCDSVARHAVSFEDSLEASFITMTSLIHSKISDSVAYAISTLIKLGVSIPQLPSRELILQQMDGTQLMLNAISGKSHHQYTRLRSLASTRALIADFIACAISTSR